MKRFRYILLLLLLCCIRLPALAQENDSVWITAELADTIKQGKEKQKPEMIVKVVENRIYVENIQREVILEIYNIMGVKVLSRRVKAGTNEYTLSLPKGYYILKIGKITKKIAVR